MGIKFAKLECIYSNIFTKQNATKQNATKQNATNKNIIPHHDKLIIYCGDIPVVIDKKTIIKSK